ncbi:MAG: DNA primase [Actinomycetota bacterium]|nr:DNA primase [Rubrobacter sp.]MDQ3508474.1 DNA primase [Actinomycetota bacterium]
MRISQNSIEAVRESANIIEVASEFTALRRQGARFVGLCPYPDHSEKTGSFSVDAEKGFYFCFGCGKGGDAIKLVGDLKSFSFTDSVSYLAERSNIELEYEGTPADADAAKKRGERRRNIHKALAAAAVYYHKTLLKSQSQQAEAARRYLESRGFNNSTIEEFRLGYAMPRGSGGFMKAAERLGFGRSVLEAAGLISGGGGERFAGRITFPISDRRGRIVGFGARAMGDDQPKYLNSPETEVFDKRSLLYGFPQVMEGIRKERAALVVEGYTDVLMLWQSGIKNAVATLGTATTPAHLRTLSGYAEKIYVLFDPDAAGEKAVERAAATAAELKLDLQVLRLSEDPADWLSEHSAEEFRELLGGAESALSYIFRLKAERARGSDAVGRSRVLQEINDLLAQIEDPVFQREARRLATEALGVSPDALGEARSPAAVSEPRRGSRARTPLDQAGYDVLAVIVARPDLTSGLIEGGIELPGDAGTFVLMPDDFGKEGHSRLFALLARHAEDDLDSLLADEEVRPFMDHIGSLAAAGERLYPTESSVREAWLRLGILSRQQKMRDAEDFDAKEVFREELQTLREGLRAITAPS